MTAAKKVKPKKKWVHSFIVDRRRWFRGNGSLGSALRTGGGEMCCLGFAALSVGLRTEQIRNQGMLSGLMPGPIEKLKGSSLGFLIAGAKDSRRDSTTGARIADINDDPCLDDEERERRLKKEFATRRIRIKFER